MAGKSLSGQWTATNTASSTVPIANVYNPSSGPTRGWLFDMDFGSDATPADNAANWYLQRATTAPTGGTSVTPALTDLADSAGVLLCMEGPTGGSTLTANTVLYNWSQNQRATFRWVATPGREFVIPSTANYGLALLCGATTNAVAWQGVFTWNE